MNEPALFYSAQGLASALEMLNTTDTTNPDIHTFFRLRDAFDGLSNNQQDYRSFYHDADGLSVRHDSVHNLYGFNMTRSASEAFGRICPDRRMLLFSRASFIGAHRYGGIWTGDNCSWWSHLLLNIKMMPSLNMCGFLYSGADTGGFGSNVSRDLLLRWLAFSIFTPLLRNHSAAGTREQEFWQFNHPEDFVSILELRYRLIPFLYSEFMKAALDNGMYFRPLGFDYPADNRAVRVEDQLMLGESVMIAPVYEQNAVGRHIYLPEPMIQVRCHPGTDHQITQSRLEKGDHYTEIALNEVVFYIIEGYIVPLCQPAAHTGMIDMTHFELLGVRREITQQRYELYADDGSSPISPEVDGIQSSCGIVFHTANGLASTDTQDIHVTVCE
jgi:alpha-glucosidase